MDEALHAAIAAVIPHCYGTVAPADAPTPYAIWQRYDGESPEYLDNEEAQVETALVQIEIFAPDILTPKTLMPALRAALRGHAELTIRPRGGFRDDVHHDMGLFSASQDFAVSY